MKTDKALWWLMFAIMTFLGAMALCPIRAFGADDDFAFEMAMARLRLQKQAGPEIVSPEPAQARQDAIAAYLAQPLNRPTNPNRPCPCGAGGCHCQPPQLCGKEPCAWHNPLLSTAGQAAGLMGTALAEQPKSLPVLPTQSCPPAG